MDLPTTHDFRRTQGCEKRREAAGSHEIWWDPHRRLYTTIGVTAALLTREPSVRFFATWVFPWSAFKGGMIANPGDKTPRQKGGPQANPETRAIASLVLHFLRPPKGSLFGGELKPPLDSTPS